MDPPVTARLLKISSTAFSDAKIMVALNPLVLIYPFPQRFFSKGLVIGSEK